jgi:hypothetical protein
MCRKTPWRLRGWPSFLAGDWRPRLGLQWAAAGLPVECRVPEGRLVPRVAGPQLVVDDRGMVAASPGFAAFLGHLG